MSDFLPFSDIMLLVLTRRRCSETATMRRWRKFEPLVEDLTLSQGESGEMNHERGSLRSSPLPTESSFNHCCRNVSARCTEVLAGHCSFFFLKDRDVLPISHHPRGLADIKLKIHIEIPGHTDCKKFKTSTNGKNIQTAWICVSRVHWVAFCSRGGPPWHVMSVDCVQYEHQL